MRIRTFIAVTSFLCSSLVWSVAKASGGNGSVVSISVHNGTQWASVIFTGAVGHSCNGANGQYVFDHTTSKGKAFLSLLESAFLAGRTIGFGGTGTCQAPETGAPTFELLGIITMS